MSSFAHQFSERGVGKWAIGYLAVAWIGLQVLQLLWEVFGWPLAPLQILIGLVAVGFPIFVFFAWQRSPADRTASTAPEATPGSHTRGLIVTGVIVAALIAGVAWTVNRSLNRAWARGEAILEMRQLASVGDNAAALELGGRIVETVGSIPAVDTLLDQVSDVTSLVTDPEGARVFRRDYADPEAPWVEVGSTPLTDIRIPADLYRWRVEADGFETVEFAAGASWDERALTPAGTIPEGMVGIPGGNSGGFVTGIGPLTSLDHAAFVIWRHEVTNGQYREFVEAGAYDGERWWTHPFQDPDGSVVTWDEAMSRFTDATGRPGPATWELGRPMEGTEDLPVTGVSWYEAAAYAEFREARLPTLRHWIRAAGTEMGGSIIPLSNFGAGGPAAPASSEGMSPSGAFDMAGNVREWLHNSAGYERHAVGGAWSDPSYFFSGPNVQPPFERLPQNGIRLARYEEDDFEGQAEIDMPLLTRDYLAETPVSDEVYRVYAAQFDYDPAPLEPSVEETIEYQYGTIERVSFDGVGWGRIHGYLYVPADVSEPYQVVIWFPGSTAAFLRPDPDPTEMQGLDAFVASGRAVFWPVMRGTYSRSDPEQPTGMNNTWPKPTREYVDLARSWVMEMRRSIDYLETRPELDADRIAYYGTSWGGRYAAIVPAVEPRIGAVISIIGGLASGQALPEVDQINYVTRVTVPFLMLNGRDDPLEPVESAQIPMYRLLGTPEADKRHVIYPGFAHRVPRNERIRESLDWLDRYFGVPSSAGAVAGGS
jgi:cephalosporin-C deacetylase-like acetyl esterase